MAETPPPAARMALQTGVSSAFSIARAATLVWLSVVAVGAAHHYGTDELGSLPIVLLVLPLPLFFAALYGWVAWMHRPSDIVFAAEDLRIESGLRGGLKVAWGDIRSVTAHRVHAWNLRVLLDSFEREDPEAEKARQQRLRERPETDVRLAILVGGEELELAEGELPIEERSLLALRDAVQRRIGDRVAENPRHREAAVLGCPSCGALVSPSISPTIACSSCRAQVTVPEAVRAGAQHARDLVATGRALATRVTAILRQARAQHVGVVFALNAALLVGVLAAEGWVLIGGGGASIGRFAAIASTPLVLTGFGYCVMRMATVAREAAAVLTLDFGAAAPSTPGGACGCRVCGAPLPQPADPILAPCAYCGAVNLYLLDLGPRRSAQQGDLRALEAQLERRRGERRKWRLLGVGCGVLFATVVTAQALV